MRRTSQCWSGPRDKLLLWWVALQTRESKCVSPPVKYKFFCHKHLEVVGRTLQRYFDQGRPPSRANDQYILDDEATKAIVAQSPRTITTLTIAELLERESVAWRIIAMKGYWVGGVDVTLPTSPKQNRTAKSMPNPNEPLIKIPAIIDRGTFLAAFSTSSDICKQY